MTKKKQERNARIIALRKKELTLRAIGKIIGISHERVRQILKAVDN